MDPQLRYQILGVMAEGEFAKVLRARDQELGRDVAIKQIHEQYLHDPAQLERYWQEAQLLASLDHPYILTVYDISRPRGWLILELMQGNIAQQLNGQPIDLDFLRVTLICALHALRILSEKHIVHGDVKPGNLLLDRANRVKLGDFSIARRLSGDDGSLVKGSTKYMAPEVVSDQFGPIGTHSDLYSLGFTAYELMCGSHFDMLFPGLDMYGGNRQMAWIMWHAALDRRLPEINRVLEGVPEDLRHVIQKLTEKDPAKRYRTPDQALADLRTKAQLPGALPPVDEAAEAEAVQKTAQADRKRRLMMYGALAFSMIMSLAMVFLPSGAPTPPPPIQTTTQVESGIFKHVDLKHSNFFLETPEGEKLPAVAFDPAHDRVYLDDQKVLLADLRSGDAIVIRRMKGEDGQVMLEVQASRDVATANGKITAIDPTLGTLTLLGTESDARPLLLDVPRSAQFSLNGSETVSGSPVAMSDFKQGDTVTIRHVPSEGRRKATSVAVQRLVPLAGTITGIDVQQRKLGLRPAGADSNSLPREMAVAEDCVIAINAETSHENQPFTLVDLRVGDHIETEHHNAIVRIDVQRRLDHQGVVQGVDPKAGTVTVQLEDVTDPVTFHVGAETKIVFAEGKRPLGLKLLRTGDKVALVHNSADLVKPQAKQITVEAQFDTQTWVLIVAEQQYADSRLDPLSSTIADAEALQVALLESRRVAEDHVVLLASPDRAKLEQAITSICEKSADGSQLIVSFNGHAYLDAANAAQLAPQDFDADNMETTGLALSWVVEQMQASTAKEKVLILDTCHAGTGELADKQPSGTELAETLRPRPGKALSKSVAILAACSPGEKGPAAASAGESPFGAAVASALSGAADVNGDTRVQANELFTAVKAALANSADSPQSPKLFLPDASPDRLEAEARQAVRQLLAHLGHNQLDVMALQAEHADVRSLADTQPDFDLAAGLVFLKHGKTSFSTQMFESALALAPESPVAHQALAWQDFSKKNYADGAEHIVRLLATVAGPDVKELSTYDTYALTWSGELAAYLQEFVPGNGPTLSKQIVEAAAERGPAAQKVFAAGREGVLSRKQELLNDYKIAPTQAEKDQLRFKAKLLTTYTQFGFEAAEAEILTQLEN
jgi:eukaryotic-like serine/threonine-protein kinase